jgi:AraC-like DNA-binding protein
MMSKVSAPDGVPASYLLRLVDGTKRWGVSERDLFRGLGLLREDLMDPDATVPIPTVEALIERARALTGEPGLGIFVGLRMPVSSHGFLGFAAMSAPTLREALELVVLYAPTRTTALTLRLEDTRHGTALVVDERVDFGKARDHILLWLLIGLCRIGNELLRQEVNNWTVHVAFAEPSYYGRFRDVLPRIHFGRSTNRIVFDASLLKAQLVSADRASLRAAREQCERLLGSAHAPSRFIDRARQLVLRAEGGARSLPELAAAMNVSSRTLRRRLTGAGSSYSAVLDKERHSRALVLLRSPGVSTKDMARRLGYSNVGNFNRALRRWTRRADVLEERIRLVEGACGPGRQ